MSTRAIYAPGRDTVDPNDPEPNVKYDPANNPRGAGGVFAGYLQGATPKYAINNGFRTDLFRNTLARMFVQVDPTELDLFQRSIIDDHVRSLLMERITGNATASQTGTSTTGGAQDASVRRSSNIVSNGYLDFFMQQVQMSLREKVQVSEGLSDNYVAYTFGQSPPIWAFSGMLINTVQDDQASNMFRLYTEILRATQMARRQKVMSMSFDSYVVHGVMMNLEMGLQAANELLVPFSFQLLVKRVFVVNYTSGWVPTQASSPFPADLNAMAFDSRPREDRALTQIAARIPNDTQEVTPTPQVQADRRVNNGNLDAQVAGAGVMHRDAGSVRRDRLAIAATFINQALQGVSLTPEQATNYLNALQTAANSPRIQTAADMLNFAMQALAQLAPDAPGTAQFNQVLTQAAATADRPQNTLLPDAPTGSRSEADSVRNPSNPESVMSASTTATAATGVH